MKDNLIRSSVVGLIFLQLFCIKTAGSQVVATGATQVSVGFDADAPNGASREPVTPPTGDSIFFSSLATNLTAGFFDTTSSQSSNVYRYSPDSGIQPISISILGKAPAKRPGNVNLLQGSFAPAVSKTAADGSYGVAFASDAIDLVTGYSSTGAATNTQVYLRIPAIDKTVLISKAASASVNSGANQSSDQPTVALVSENPHVYRVCFQSSATNLVMGITAVNNLYCRDATVDGQSVTLGTTQSVKPTFATGNFKEPSLSADGTKLVFSSDATIIINRPNNGTFQVYMYTFATSTFRLVSKNANGAVVIGSSDTPAISSDGSVISFRYDGLNADGLADLEGFEGVNKIILVKYLVANDSYSQVNVNTAAIPSNGNVAQGRLDAAGRYFVFSDSGTNLVSSPDVSGLEKVQVYLKDADSGEILCMSVTQNNLAGADDSGVNNPPGFAPAVAVGHTKADQTDPFVAFLSFAINLASVGIPNSTEPYIFRSGLSTPTPTPTETPTPTATPQQLRDNLRITVPPVVEGEKRPDGLYDMIITMPQFVFGPKKSAIQSFFEAAARQGKISYEVEVRKAGSSKRINRVVSRNTTTIRKLTAGRYSVRYRVNGTLGKNKAQSRYSPRTTITFN